MKSKFLFFLILGVSNASFAATSYEISATVTDQEQELVFPKFKVSSANQSGTSFVDGCTYKGQLTEQNEGVVQVTATVSCEREDSNYTMDMPILIFNLKDKGASYALIEGEVVMWEYAVQVTPIR
ncbi:hypothetical protein ACB087_16230 [Vibrio sp. VNB-15]